MSRHPSITIPKVWGVALLIAVSSWIAAFLGMCGPETFAAATYWPLFTALVASIFARRP